MLEDAWVPRSYALMPSFVETAALRPPESDAALVRRAAGGDRVAFSALIERHYDFMHRTATKWLGRRQDADDVAQDVCVKLATAVRQFDERSAFTSWLYRVVLNAVRDHQRASSRRGRNHDRFAEVHPEAMEPDQEDSTAASELWRAVQLLPRQQRDAVMLVYAEEMSHAEAGAIMGCKEATVSWHIHEAKKTLRGLL